MMSSHASMQRSQVTPRRPTDPGRTQFGSLRRIVRIKAAPPAEVDRNSHQIASLTSPTEPFPTKLERECAPRPAGYRRGVFDAHAVMSTTLTGRSSTSGVFWNLRAWMGASGYGHTQATGLGVRAACSTSECGRRLKTPRKVPHPDVTDTFVRTRDDCGQLNPSPHWRGKMRSHVAAHSREARTRVFISYSSKDLDRANEVRADPVRARH